MARRVKSLSQERLAEAANLSTTYIGRLERGEKTPSIETLVVISESLDTSPLDLLIDLETALGREHLIDRIRKLLDLL